MLFLFLLSTVFAQASSSHYCLIKTADIEATIYLPVGPYDPDEILAKITFKTWPHEIGVKETEFRPAWPTFWSGEGGEKNFSFHHLTFGEESVLIRVTAKQKFPRGQFLISQWAKRPGLPEVEEKYEGEMRCRHTD